MNQIIIEDSLIEDDGTVINLACDEEACHIATNEFDLIQIQPEED